MITETGNAIQENIIPQDTAKEVPVTVNAGKKLSFAEKAETFIAAYTVNYDEKKSDKRSILDRFDFTWNQKSILTKKFTVPYGETEVNPSASLGFFEYADSSQRANAMSNWLACFGNDCHEIIPGKEVQIKSTPGFYIINEKEIVTLDYPLEHEKNNWDEMKKNLQRVFSDHKTLYIIEVAPHGKLKWIKK